MSSGKTICKEVCSKCKCIVKEKPLNKEKERGKSPEAKSKECTATIVGVITLPENMCIGDRKTEEKNKSDGDCTEVYRDLGECLQKAIVKVSCDQASGTAKKGQRIDDPCQ